MQNKFPRRKLDARISCKNHPLAQPSAEGAESRPAWLWRVLLKAPQENTTTLLSPIHFHFPITAVTLLDYYYIMYIIYNSQYRHIRYTFIQYCILHIIMMLLLIINFKQAETV